MTRQELRKFIVPMVFIFILLLLFLFYLVLKNEKDKSDNTQPGGLSFESQLNDYLETTSGSYFKLHINSAAIFDDMFSSFYSSGELFLNGYLGEQCCYFKIYPGADDTNEDLSTEIIINPEGTYLSTKNFNHIFGYEPYLDRGYFIRIGNGAYGHDIKKNLITNINDNEYENGVTQDNYPSIKSEDFHFYFLTPIGCSSDYSLNASIIREGEIPERRCVIVVSGDISMEMELNEVSDFYVTKAPTKTMELSDYYEITKEHDPDGSIASALQN